MSSCSSYCVARDCPRAGAGSPSPHGEADTPGLRPLCQLSSDALSVS
jgi:hypothetical protein